MSAPLVGRRVVVSGLTSKPELNGTKGTAASFDEDRGRYNVKLDSTGSFMALKPASLTAETSDDAHFSGGAGGGGMPSFGMPGGAPAAMLQALLARAAGLLPAGVSPVHAGLGALAVVYFVLPALGISLPLAMGVALLSAFVYRGAADGNGAHGIASASKAALGRAAATASRLSGQSVSVPQVRAYFFLALTKKIVYSGSMHLVPPPPRASLASP